MTFPLFPLLLPSYLLGWLYVGVMLCGFARKPQFMLGVLTAEWRPWVAERWLYSTTIGHGVIFHPRATEKTAAHEFVHIRQFEDATLRGLYLGLFTLIVADWRALLMCWCLGPTSMMVGWLSGWIRFGDPYRGAEFERSAYEQDDHINPDGTRKQ